MIDVVKICKYFSVNIPNLNNPFGLPQRDNFNKQVYC